LINKIAAESSSSKGKEKAELELTHPKSGIWHYGKIFRFNFKKRAAKTKNGENK
jgi:hypothetical protein